MQPYLLPYIGYFQLINHVDRFVVYDRIKYTKKGWINRNRMLRNGDPVTFTVPVRKDADHLDIYQRYVAESYVPGKLIGQIEGAYRGAPQFAVTMPVVHEILNYASKSLFDFLDHSLRLTCQHIGIKTPIVVSSAIEPLPCREASPLQGQDRVIGICTALGATDYVNPIGGLELYDAGAFAAHDVSLGFIRTTKVHYAQFVEPFQPSLSILDVMMFNDLDRICEFLTTGFERVAPRS
ncbi:WbqC family protein [Seohaeicola saemankumensis]